jgi:23S rRNA U2552 (ribose-2'-O)-methylase RlmE/FtsJ
MTETTEFETTDEINENNEDYKPLIIKLTINDTSEDKNKQENIFNYKSDPEYIESPNIEFPNAKYGFHHWLHLKKNEMSILNNFKNKKKVYRITNAFERFIDNYENDINGLTEKYFEIKTKLRPKILSRGFFKLWEILMIFDLIPNDKPIVTAHLAEGPGSFIQATMYFRDLFSSNYKKDKYYAVTLHKEDEGEYVPALETSFLDFYKKDTRIYYHKTYPSQVAGGETTKDNGDIVDPKTIELFGGEMQSKADLITADGGFNWNNENTQEQEAFKLVYGQITAAIKLQKKGGAFVCKFFETYTKTSIKMLYILNSCYKTVYIIKPFTSRKSNSEKYAVCIDFKYENNSEYEKILKELQNILKHNHKTKNNLINIFPSFRIPKSYSKQISQINIKIANEQLLRMYDFLKFIESQNYYGDYYHKKRKEQIDASVFWSNLFYPEDKSFERIKQKYEEYK